MANRADADIESFAELTARLDHPFADRASILRSAGLDEAAYLRHKNRWSADLAGALSPELAQRFGEAYARAVHAKAEPIREEAAIVARETKAEAPWVPEGMRHFTSLQETQPAADGPPPARPVLPFDAAAKPSPSPPLPVRPPAPPALGDTAGIDPLALPAASAVLPFDAAATPGKRLIRFDSQTGEPLPTPVWVDLPASPERKR